VVNRRKNRVGEWWTTKTRDFVLFVGGMLGVIYETLVEKADRPALLAVFGGMLGLPVFLRRDEQATDDDEDDAPTKPGKGKGS